MMEVGNGLVAQKNKVEIFWIHKYNEGTEVMKTLVNCWA